MKWITREHPKIDRIACAWLITRFIDKEPEFFYVLAGKVLRIATEPGATPYDVPGVELGHHGEQCSFDAFIAKYAIKDSVLEKLVLIVRATDCGHLELAREAAGLLAAPLLACGVLKIAYDLALWQAFRQQRENV